MDFHNGNEARKIHWTYIILTLLLTRTVGSFILDDSHCHYVYNLGCRTTRNDSAETQHEVDRIRGSCSVDDIGEGVKFTVLRTKNQQRPAGILKVNFTLPNAECNYQVALLVNTSITNHKDCKNHEFHKSNSYDEEIHSIEKTVCVLSRTNLTEGNNCQKNKFSMWYEHVFTGCYALRFTVDGYKYSVRGNRFIVTDYNREEVMEPKFRCHYEDRTDVQSSKQELVTFGLSISVHAGTAGMILTLTPMSYMDEIKDNACVHYSEQPLYAWAISTDESRSPAATLKNCSSTTVKLDNETYTRDTECNFALKVPINASYCLKIRLDDDRCNRQTIWKPPPDGEGGKPACAWLQSCTRIVKNTSAIEYNGVLHNSKQINTFENNILLLLPIAIAIIIILIVITAIVLFRCRILSRKSTKLMYPNTNLKNINITRCAMEIESIETTDDEITQISSIINGEDDDQDENEPIILLYAHGTVSFMNLMTDLREILKINCGCRVRDWYAASEWDDVARIGPSSWVGDLLRHKHRAIWIDTPRARNLINSQWKDDASTDSGVNASETNAEAIGDFRDLALSNVLDLAKRSIASLGYNKHFVVRLEGFDAKNEREHDPFEDLSPHTRYLIPLHLSELCSHLSPWPTNINSQLPLKTQEAKLRERLVRMNNNSPGRLETKHWPYLIR